MTWRAISAQPHLLRRLDPRELGGVLAQLLGDDALIEEFLLRHGVAVFQAIVRVNPQLHGCGGARHLPELWAAYKMLTTS
jgi:hypothetical protein